jgi:UDP-N-acetylglucosamine 2-epimerase (non-hydrolysing)
MIAKKKTVIVVFGTRPEAVKMVPVVKALELLPGCDVVTVSTGQHREMLTPVLKRFGVAVDFPMDLMEPDQSLYRLSAKTVAAFEEVLAKNKPSMLLVQGDTTTAFLGALCAFYGKIPVGHVEAGLRTNNKYFPFPEEINRRLISVVSNLNFAATTGNRDNLLREGLRSDSIFVTGNTGIDALLVASKFDDRPVLTDVDMTGKRLVLVTIHRRESFGDVMEGMFLALRDIARAYKDVQIVYPVHLNPNVRKLAFAVLNGVANIRLVEPMDYFDFIQVMKRSFLILTDSGGIQEEAPTLGVPVLVLRNETERPEGVVAGTVRLAGTTREGIFTETSLLLDNERERQKLREAKNPYGDGHAAERIARHVMEYLNRRTVASTGSTTKEWKAGEGLKS